MDWFPLWNSLRIAAISTIVIFFTGIYAAWSIAKLPRVLKGILDVILTLPLVLPPTVVGFFLLKLLGPYSMIGSFILETANTRLVMEWYSAIFASVVVAFPLMYRTARGAFESFDPDLHSAGQTLGMPNWKIFWKIVLPTTRQGILAGTVLAFARALGEYGATSMISGYTPGRTATISTTVYQLWRTGNDAEAYMWVLTNVAISFVVLLTINSLEARQSPKRAIQEMER
ncbi:MAG: molybdate ABC transporter permease subunit [Chloroflexi bacterium]|nr:molybdate ABC transporter permease subunit [Chloroflexota bacterium]